ncbi:MAG: hypothetical protein HKM93_04360 [Desulfobacteraceae bacterium]|nr:hypothetical protein [Desulfobacteraceae bacterium]
MNRTRNREGIERYGRFTERESDRLETALNRCFVEIILPAIFDIERDLIDFDYWYQLDISQDGTLRSGKPRIKRVTLSFYPEKKSRLGLRSPRMDSIDHAVVKPSADLKNIVFIIEYATAVSSMDPEETQTYALEDISKKTVNRFLEDFVMDATDAYKSERILR